MGDRVDGGEEGDHRPVEDFFFPACHGWIGGCHEAGDEAEVGYERTVEGSSQVKASQRSSYPFLF